MATRVSRLAANLPRGDFLAVVWRNTPHGVDVLITHGPPHGIGDEVDGAGQAGCADLRGRLAEVAPRLHLFGHVHQPRALYNLGAFHATGIGFPQSWPKAVAYDTQAAELGNPQAARLARMYLTGEGVEVDLDEAAHWLDVMEELGWDIGDVRDAFGSTTHAVPGSDSAAITASRQTAVSLLSRR
ncbi:MAG: hypothetical protein AB7O24_31925 [Kofleriaceae bacterium]